MRLTNLTRGNEIGANSYLLDFDGDGRVVVDAGMHPRREGLEATPLISTLPSDSIQAIFLSHAHHDHLGALPLLMRQQPKAPVFMSEGTSLLADPLLHNSIEVMLKQKVELGIAEFPLYTHKEVDKAKERFRPCGTSRCFSLSGEPNPDQAPVTFQFHDAGHVLGSVGVEWNHRGKRIFYTGDVNFKEQTLCHGADFPEEKLDVLITETTRGAHPSISSRENEVDKLVDAIQGVFRDGGAALIPVFALGKTQETLTLIYELQRQRRLPKGPLYIGGLGRSLTQVYDKISARTSRHHQGLSLLKDIAPEVLDGRRLHELRPRRGEIYLISSGMMNEKTLSNVVAQRFLSEPRHGIFFVGYCDPTSPAGRLLKTPKGGEVELDHQEGPQAIKCRVSKFDLTAHAQREDLLSYILKTDPSVCVLVHGDPESMEWFRQQLADQKPKMRVVIPPPGVAIEL